jgi:polyhydroxybutyrate depolymerase
MKFKYLIFSISSLFVMGNLYAQASLPLVPQKSLPIEMPKISEEAPVENKTDKFISLDDLKKIQKDQKKSNTPTVTTPVTPPTINDINPSADGYVLPKVEENTEYTKEELTFDRLKRNFLVSNAIDVKTEKNLPAIILLHPSEQTAENVWSQTTLPRFAKENKYLLVAPQALNNHWNDGNMNPISGEYKTTVDDVGFLLTLIDKLTHEYSVDPKKVFIVGISNGGFMATHYVCRIGDTIRGGVNILSLLHYDDSRRCTSSSVPWLSMNSGNDAFIPYLGQARGRDNRGNPQDIWLSAEQTFNFFNTRNQCRQEGPYKQLPHFNKNDNTAAFIKVANNCANGTSNILLAFRNAGHQLPNVNKNYGSPYEGLSNQDIDPGTAIIHFFNSILKK